MATFKAWKDGKCLDPTYFGSEFLTLDVGLIERIQPEFLTAINSVSRTPKRERGKYRYCSAEAELDYAPSDSHCSLVMKFNRPQDGLQLYELIRTGDILPEKSYEREQIAWPPRHVKDVFREVWSIIRRKLSGLRYRFEQFGAN